MTTKPSFSILVANRNYGQLVTRAVDSALAQHYPVELREVIVVDDGSTDDSRQRLERYCDTPGVTVLEQPNRGQTAAFAAALEAARGDYVCLLDSDDLCLPEKLETLARHIRTLTGPTDDLFLCHDLLLIDGADGQPIEHTYFSLNNLKQHGPQMSVASARQQFPFSVTSGMVFGRTLLQRLLRQAPVWEWPMGTDGLVGHAAMLTVGEVHYVQQPLGCYVIHKRNNLASIVDGRFVAKPIWQQRGPKTLRYLELLVEQLPLGEWERSEGIAYLSRLEHMSRTPRPRAGTPSPTLAVVVDCTQCPPSLEQTWINDTATALAAQLDVVPEVLWVLPRAASIPSRTPQGAQVIFVDPASSEYARMRSGYYATRGGYVGFVAAGDVPDPRWAMRHLHEHRFGSLPMLTVSDLNLIAADGVILHTSVMGVARKWGHVQATIPALSKPLAEWLLAPLPAVVLRRSPFMDAFFRAESLPVDGRLVGWLLCQYLLQMGGGTRLAENLMGLRLPPEATPTPSWLAVFIDRAGPVRAPDLALAAEELLAAYLRATERERACMPELWETHFVRWLAASAGAGAVRLELRAAREGGSTVAAKVASMLRMPNPTRSG
jgi:hypothetical protein